MTLPRFVRFAAGVAAFALAMTVFFFVMLLVLIFAPAITAQILAWPALVAGAIVGVIFLMTRVRRSRQESCL